MLCIFWSSSTNAVQNRRMCWLKKEREKKIQTTHKIFSYIESNRIHTYAFRFPTNQWKKQTQKREKDRIERQKDVCCISLNCINISSPF